MKPYHPMRDDKPVVYRKIDTGSDNPRKEFVAFFDNPELPICFWADTHEEAHSAAVLFRDDAVERNEAAYLKRREALEKSQKARAKKKEGAA